MRRLNRLILQICHDVPSSKDYTDSWLSANPLYITSVGLQIKSRSTDTPSSLMFFTVPFQVNAL
jgi:hypothetical protein